MMTIRSIFRYAAIIMIANTAAAQSTQTNQFLEELKATGGRGLGAGYAGVAGDKDHASFLINPALISQNQQYDLGAAYLLANRGPNLWQASIIDSFTSQFAVGLKYQEPLKDTENLYPYFPINKRYQLALASNFGQSSLGITVQRAESTLLENGVLTDINVTSVGFGLLHEVNDKVKIGASAMNLENQDYNQVSPKVFRLGASYDFHEKVGVLIDYASETWSTVTTPVTPAENKSSDSIILSSHYLATNNIKLTVALGKTVSGEDSSILAGGIHFNGEKYEVGYQAAKMLQGSEKITNMFHVNMTLKSRKQD